MDYIAFASSAFMYAISVLVVAGIIVAAIIIIRLYQRLADGRRQTILQEQRIRQLSDSPPAEQKNFSFLRKLIDNRSIAQLSGKDYLLLVEECRMIDPEFFTWLKKQGCQLTSRYMVLCVLIRMNKKKEEILTIFCMSNDTYRTMKSRVRKYLGIGDKKLEVFLNEKLDK